MIMKTGIIYSWGKHFLISLCYGLEVGILKGSWVGGFIFIMVM